MSRFFIAAILCAVVLCGVAVPAAQAADKTISIVFDDGAASLDAGHARERGQIGSYMDKDLVRVFARFSKQGYEAALIGSANEFKPAPGSYLLNVTITEYNAGSKAARMFVGFGAGGMNLKVKIELLDQSKKTLLSKEESSFSGRDWRNVVRKVNELIADSVVGAIGK
jgi:hypothetical protein